MGHGGSKSKEHHTEERYKEEKDTTKGDDRTFFAVSQNEGWSSGEERICILCH
jgi:hypothetical protein